MEYKPALPEHNDNVSHDKPVREFFLLFSGITTFLLLVFWALGMFVDFAVDYISPEAEAVIFSPMGIPSSESNYTGNQKQAELQKLVDGLSGCVDIPYPLKVQLVESEHANAIAFPGGRIIVLSSLLKKVQSENGLSFVLAHELAHFKNRDHLRSLGRGIVLTALMAAVTGSDSSLTKMFAPALGFDQAQYSQEREKMADEQGIQILNCYYGHVGGATEFFEAMMPNKKQPGQMIGKYFSSHPEGVKRIKNLHQLTKDFGFDEEKVQLLSPVITGQ